MAQDGDIVFLIGADVAGLTKAGQTGERSLADMEKAAKTLERQISKMGESGVAFQREMNKLSGVTRDVEKSARESAAAFEAFERSKQQVDNLRASIDPLFAASKRYEQALGTLDAALEQGAISARQHAAMTEQLAAAYLRADGATTAMGGRMGFLGGVSEQTRGKIQQVGFQVQDFAVQVGAGTSATQAFAQQFPQLAGAFGPVGVAIGTLAAIGIPLLAAAFGSAEEKADGLSEAMKRQKAVTDELMTAVMALRLQSEMLSAGTKTEAEQKALQENVRLLAERNVLEMERADLIAKANEAMGVLNQAALDALNARIAEINATRASNDQLLKNIATERARVEALERARALGEKFKALQEAIARENINGPWAAVLGPIQQAIDKANEYRRAMAAAAYDAELAATGQSSGPDAARTNVQFGGPIALSPTGAGMAFTPAPGGGGGGGGGQNPIEAQLEQLRQQVMTEEQIELESYTKRQEMLQQALDQRLLTQQEYAALMEQAQQQHSDRMSEIDVWRYGTDLDKAEAFFGGMASALQGGNEKMLAISKKFAAAEALINAWKGFSDVLADKTLPFWAKIPSAMKVLAAGIGAVNAIKGGGGGRSVASAAGAGGAAAAPQAPGQTLNFTIQNDPFGIGERTARMIADRMNEASRNGVNLRATVTST